MAKYRWGRRSLQRLEDVEQSLVRLMTAAIADERCPCDVTVVEGHRTMARQAELYAKGRTAPGPRVTNARPGQSRHNSMPSQAVDVGPCDRHGNVLWNDRDAFDAFGRHVETIAGELDIPVRWGGRFSFYDGAHFELQED